MLLSGLGQHLQLTKVFGDKSIRQIYPQTTSDVVIVNEMGNNLFEFLPMAVKKNGDGEGNPIEMVSTTEIDVNETVANLLLN